MDWSDPTRRNAADAFSLEPDKQSRVPLGPARSAIAPAVVLQTTAQTL